MPEARRGFETVLQLDPGFADAHHNLGLVAIAEQRFEEAVTAFAGARERSPTKPETLLNLGYSLDRTGRLGCSDLATDQLVGTSDLPSTRTGRPS